MFHQPHTLDEALDLRARLGDSAMVVRGGTDVLVGMNKGQLRPRHFLDLSHVAELDGVQNGKGTLCMGSGVTFAQMGRMNVSCLREAALSVGGPQIRNTGTIGGNLVTASPAADGCVALLALDAEVEVASAARGPRRLDADREWFLGYRKTALAEDELVTHVRIRSDFQTAWYKIGKRGAVNISLVCCAIGRSPDDRYRIAFGSVAFRPVRAPRAEALLNGQSLTAELIEQAARTAMGEVAPIDDHRSSAAYRRAMCGVLVRRLLSQISRSGASPDGAEHGRRGRQPPVARSRDHEAPEGRHN